MLSRGKVFMVLAVIVLIAAGLSGISEGSRQMYVQVTGEDAVLTELRDFTNPSVAANEQLPPIQVKVSGDTAYAAYGWAPVVAGLYFVGGILALLIAFGVTRWARRAVSTRLRDALSQAR